MVQLAQAFYAWCNTRQSYDVGPFRGLTQIGLSLPRLAISLDSFETGMRLAAGVVFPLPPDVIINPWQVLGTKTDHAAARLPGEALLIQKHAD